jgi:hypothetical protein
MANPFSGSLQYNSSSVSDKLERTFAIQAELINALRTHGCPSCLQLLREIVKNTVECLSRIRHSKHQTGESRLTFLILENSSEELFKDIFWPDLIKGLWRQKKLINPIYDDQDHGVSCKCCSRIIKESTTCPTKRERKQRRQRGRPKLKRGGLKYD